LINRAQWARRQALKDRGRATLRNIAENWETVEQTLSEEG
jgi:hypothetical protein